MPQIKNRKMKEKGGKAKPTSSAVISGQLEKKMFNRSKTSKAKPERGIVFVSKLPHGFYEEQIKDYFKQYGKITRVRLVRSKRTGGSKGFAYVEFEVPDVAKIAAETMDNTQMFQKVVKAAYIPPEEQKYDYFKTSLKLVRNESGKLRAVSKKSRKIAKLVEEHNNWDKKNVMKRAKLSLQKLGKLSNKLSDVGLNLSDLIIAPKNLKVPKTLDGNQSNTSQEEATMESSLVEHNDTETSEDEGANSQVGSLLLIKKRKSSSSEGKVKGNKKKAIASNQNTSLGLEDLLGTTLNEDSSDEEFIPLVASDDEELEEDLSDAECDVDASSGSDSEEEAIKEIKKSRNTKISKPDRFEKILKRNPNPRGIQKPKKKAKKMAGKEKLKAAAAQEIFSKQNKKTFKKIQKKAK